MKNTQIYEVPGHVPSYLPEGKKWKLVWNDEFDGKELDFTPEQIEGFLDLAAELKCEGKTVIMVLHDLEQALRCSDQIVVMDDGAVVQTGTPQEILDAGTLTDIFHVTVSDGYCFKKASPHLR